MELKQYEIDFAASQIAKIDSGERHVFLENVNTEKQIEAEIFSHTKAAGVFYSCMYYDKLRIHIAFEADIGEFNEEIGRLTESSIKKSGSAPVMIWLRNENRKIIEYLKCKFNFSPDYYASAEFIMRRNNFHKKPCKTLAIKPYQEKHIDDYLLLLDEAMTFERPSPNYRNNKARYLEQFAEYHYNNSFEAFWKEGELIGLYWRKDNEIDHLAVSAYHQRMGYGSVILTRAIERALEKTDKEFAYLYAVDWNEKGQAFYRKYGMEENGHSYLLSMGKSS